MFLIGNHKGISIGYTGNHKCLPLFLCFVFIMPCSSFNTAKIWYSIMQREELQKVMDLLLLKEHHARTLLIHYRWDFERMLAVFVEQGKDQLYSQAGVVDVVHLNLTSLQFSSKVTCAICYEDVFADKITTMDCGHYFCNNCKCLSL